MKNTNPQIPVLYSLRSDGKIQSWQVEVKGNQFRTISGIQDGKTVTSEWTTCKGKNPGRKNATTAESQAQKEAQALWKKKCDEGYKTQVTDVHVETFFAPMLAHKYEDHQKIVREQIGYKRVYAQPKLDGIRAIVTKDGMTSRNGKPIVSAPHIFEALKPLFEHYPNAVFDGELYADKFSADFNTIVSLAKKTKPTAEDLEESKRHLEYHVYDMPRGPLSSNEAPFDERYRLLSTLIAMLNETEPLTKIEPSPDQKIRLVQTIEITRIEELDMLYSHWVSQGYEGQMIRLADKPYEQKRSKNLLKRKEFQDDEFEVLDVIEGVGNRSGMAGYLTFKTKDGNPFTSAIKGNVEFFRKLLVQKDQIIGKKATVKYFNITPAGVPRFPVVTSIRDYE